MATAQKFALIGAILVLIVVAAGTIAGLNRPVSVPNVTFIGFKGDHVSMFSLKGKGILVNFWATTCTICMHEMPKIVETYQKFHPRGFGTVAVAMSYDPPDRVFGYAEQTRLPFHVALDLFGQVVRVFGGVEGTLTNFLLDKRGRIVRGFQGEPDFEDLAKPIEKELKREA